MRHQRLIRAQGFVDTANAACASSIEFLRQEELAVEDYANLLAQLYSVEVQIKMARELITESMKQALLEKQPVQP